MTGGSSRRSKREGGADVQTDVELVEPVAPVLRVGFNVEPGPVPVGPEHAETPSIRTMASREYRYMIKAVSVSRENRILGRWWCK